MAEYEDALRPGTVLQGGMNSYRIDRMLGQGAFGITYLAYTRVAVTGQLGTLQSEILVAVKEFFMNKINGRNGSTVTNSGGRGGMFEDYRRKFVREARSLSKLEHPGIVRVVETFDANGTSYYVMEYCSGGSLDALIARRGGIPQGEALALFGQMALALAYMHSRRMLHLDLKPANVMLRGDGRPVLIDFGLAKQFDKNGEPEASTTIGRGTPGYAPIEQSDYNEEEHKARFPVTMDIYALGATLYKMLTGERPPKASDVLAYGFPEQPFREHGVSGNVVAAIRRAMQPKPGDRYQTVTDFAAASGIAIEVAPHNEEETHKTDKTQHDDEVEGVILVDDGKGNRDDSNLQSNLPEIEMVWVSGGTFTMGATSEQGGAAYDWEKPAHSVTLSGYYIGKYEVTQKLWKAVMGSNPSYFKGDNLPVENVNWNDVQTFIRKLNQLTGKNYRLPTEAEWEYAARGGNNSRGNKYSGSDNVGSVAWYYENSGSTTHPVGSKSPNELGIYDMSGNVWEWCQDWYGDYSSSSQRNPKGPASGSNRVGRSGGWCNGAGSCRVSYRLNLSPVNRYDFLGFRLVL